MRIKKIQKKNNFFDSERLVGYENEYSITCEIEDYVNNQKP